MSIAPFIKDIGRGKDGARSLSREQAATLFGALLDGEASDLEVGAFCIAMRVKGETPEELAGFIEATEARLQKVAVPGHRPAVVLPSYNGARKLPLLTPLLAGLLAQRGVPVVLHGTATESRRCTSPEVWAELQALGAAPAGVQLLPTSGLLPGLDRLLQVRRTIGLRNSAHSVVKLMNPCRGPAVVVGCYTHPEYRHSMSATCALLGSSALLMRGTEGEPVADLRRRPAMVAWHQGQGTEWWPAQDGPLLNVPEMPEADARATAVYTAEVLSGRREVPLPLAQQVQALTEGPWLEPPPAA